MGADERPGPHVADPGGTRVTPHCKGVAVLARLKWVQQVHGDAGFTRFLAALPPSTRDAVDARILPHGWVSFQVFIDVLVTLDGLFGQGDLSLCRELGGWAAAENLPRVFKIFFRFGSPTFIFDRAAKLWSSHYDSGTLVVVDREETAARLVISDFAAPHRAHCLSVLGWAAKSIELSGSEVTYAEEEKCRTRGDEACEMVVRWK